MGEQFIIQVEHAVIVINEDLLYQVNPAIKALGGDLDFEQIYGMSLNPDNGKVRVAGRVRDEAGNLVDESCELKLRIDGVKFSGEKIEVPRYVPLFQIPELIANIKGWSTARGILENGLWYSQATKMYEEDGEVAPGVAKNKRNLVIDGVGDMIVVMVNLLELTGINASAIERMVEAVRSGGEELPKMSGAILNHWLYHKLRYSNTIAVDVLWDVGFESQAKKITGDMFEDEQIQYTVGHLTDCIHYANQLASVYGFTLEQALSLAWDEIKDRTGFLNADGIFVKESDMTDADKQARAAAAEKPQPVEPQENDAVTTVEVTYFPIRVNDEIRNIVTKAIRDDGVDGEVIITRAGRYVSGASKYPTPHVLAEFEVADGVGHVVIYPDNLTESVKLEEEAVSYIFEEVQ